MKTVILYDFHGIYVFRNTTFHLKILTVFFSADFRHEMRSFYVWHHSVLLLIVYNYFNLHYLLPIDKVLLKNDH